MLSNQSGEARDLFDVFNERIMTIADDISSKATSNGVSYSAEGRRFISLDFRSDGFRLILFTRGETLEDVERTWDAHGELYGSIMVNGESTIEKAVQACSESYDRIKKALANKERTGWWAGHPQ